MTKFLWGVVLLIILSTVGEGNTSPNRACNPDDLKGLTSFKAGIHVDTSDRLATWVGSDCCAWDGITCDNRTGRVTEISLPGFMTKDGAPFDAWMEGSLSSKITLVSFLEVLHLGDYSGLSGKIPKLIGFRLPKLRKLYLYQSSLTGPIPESIGKLSNLEELFLPGNKFSGSIPSSIGSLKNLSSLQLYSNRLSGCMPDSLASLTNLVHLDLNSNSLTGHIPQRIGQLQVLQDLDLSNNLLSGKLPPSMANLSAIQVIWLDTNFLEGPIPFPSTSAKMTYLRLLRLQNNRLIGKIPPNFGDLVSLEVAFLSNNKLEGEIPKSIGQLSHLAYFNISHNMIQGSLPSEMSSLKNLNSLDLSFNRLRFSSVPKWFAELPVSRISLASCGIQGQIPELLRTIPTFIQELDLSANNLTGTIPTWIGDGKFAQALYSLNLSNNSLVSKIPDSIANLQRLILLDLHANKLASNLPEALGNLSMLETLELQQNRFSGKIPYGFLKLRELKTLNLSDNLLEGKIPEGKPLSDFPKSSYSGNNGLCGKPLAPCKAWLKASYLCSQITFETEF